jgi:hypothetical protein
MKDGRRFGCPPKPYSAPQVPEGKINTTDPDARGGMIIRNIEQNLIFSPPLIFTLDAGFGPERCKPA